MSELLSQLWTPELQAAFTVVVILLVILYVLSIVWVVRDAYLRGSYWYVWAIVALIPLLGIIAYCLLRPPLLQIDRDEQELLSLIHIWRIVTWRQKLRHCRITASR